MKGVFLKCCYIALIVFCSIYCLARPGFCGEFVSKQRSLSLDDGELSPREVDRVPEITKSRDNETIYKDFTNKIKTLSPEKRSEVNNAFKQRLADAQKNSRWEEVSYYSKLLEILEITK